MKRPLVSILIPAFNSEQWIAESLASAINQTWDRKEIIVVDDGSSDHTLAIARQFASRGVNVVTQENQGASAARNKALSLSDGAYIQWLDADDLLLPDKIAKQMDALDRCDSRRTLASGPWASFIYRYHRAHFVPTDLWCDLTPVEWLLCKMGCNLYMQTATWLVSRELTDAAGPWNTHLTSDDDGEYFCRVLLQSDGIRFVPDATVYYRKATSCSLSCIGSSSQRMESQFLSMQLHVRYLRSLEESERVRAVCVKYLQNWLINFYPERLDIVGRAEQLAHELGGRLHTPQLSWKYDWIRALFGWNIARRVQRMLPRLRWSVVFAWDKALFQAQQLTTVASLPGTLQAGVRYPPSA